MVVTNSYVIFNRMYSGALGVPCLLNLLFFKVMFLLNSLALKEEISNSCVYEVPTERFLSFFLVGAP